MNIRRLFLKLTEYTIPNGMEYTLEKFFPTFPSILTILEHCRHIAQILS